jgi:hypothetical protein
MIFLCTFVAKNIFFCGHFKKCFNSRNLMHNWKTYYRHFYFDSCLHNCCVNNIFINISLYYCHYGLGFSQKLWNKNFKLNLYIKWLVVVTKPLPINTKFPSIWKYSFFYLKIKKGVYIWKNNIKNSFYKGINPYKTCSLIYYFVTENSCIMYGKSCWHTCDSKFSLAYR